MIAARLDPISSSALAPASVARAAVSARPKPRLLHILGYAARGGCEACCAVFIRNEPRCDHHLIVLGEPGPMTAEWQALGATTNHLNALGLGWSDFRRRLQDELSGETCAGVILWAGIRVPLVLDALAAGNFPTVVHAGNPFVAGRRVRALLSLSAVFARRPRRVTVIGCSDHVAQSFAHAPYYRKLRIESCLNPVVVPTHNPHQPRALGRHDRIRIGMVARLDPIKDHATLLWALPLVQAHWPNAELHLAGDGPLRATLEELARSLGIAAAVKFHGSVGDVPAFLQSLDLFCYVTTAQEGMGIALAEALAAGLPCVVNDLPVMREVAGEQAACFAPAKPLEISRCVVELLHNEPERRRLSHAAWRRAGEAFAASRAVDRYLDALEIHP